MESKFSIEIKVNDETGIWMAIWNNLKDHLNLNFVPLSYKENNNTKSLGSLNLKLSTNAENSILTIYVFKLNSFADLKPNVKENIIKVIQSEKDILPIMLMEIDNTDSSLKSSLKVFEKIKSELKLNFIKLLPLNTNHTKLLDLINDFFRELKNRISFDISKMFFTYSSNIDNLKLIKLDNKENTYCYIANKDNLIQLLQVADFYMDIIKICEADLNLEFKHLDSYPQKAENKNHTSYFNELFSLIDFNEDLIKSKIEKRTLTNIDYQIYLFHLICNNYKQMREFKKLYSFVLKFLNNINNLKSFFLNVYYYNFWCIDFMSKIIPFYKALRNNYLTAFEEEMNLKARNQVLYLLKKNYKSFSKLVNFELPNSKIFKILASSTNNGFVNCHNIDVKNDEKEINHLELSFENQLERKIKNHVFGKSNASTLKNSDENYANFISDINKNLDEKSKSLVLCKQKLFEEYLNIINNLEKSHFELKEKRLLFRLQLEKLPMLFALGKFNEMKILLLDNLKKIKKLREKNTKSELIDNNCDKSKYTSCVKYSKTNVNTKENANFNNIILDAESDINDDLNKWPLLKEYVCSLLILLLNSLEKSTENIRIIIDILNIYQSNDTISCYFDLKDNNVIKTILTKYLDDNINQNNKHSNSNNSYSAISNGERENVNSLFKINLNEIIDFDYSVSDTDNKTDINPTSNNEKANEIYKNIYFYNKQKTKNINFNFGIKNRTDLEMKITSITIEFYDEVNNQKVKYDYIPIINHENSDNKESENTENSNIFIIKGSNNTSFKLELDIDNLDKIKNLSISSLVISKIYLYLTWGLLGIYKFNYHDSILYLKNNDFEVYSSLHNFYFKNSQIINRLVTFNKNLIKEATNKDTIHPDFVILNADNPLFINFCNMKEFDFSKYYIDIDLKLTNSSMINKDHQINDLIKSKTNISDDENNEIQNNNKYNEDEAILNLEILNDLEIIYLDGKNKNETPYFFISLPPKDLQQQQLNENSIEKYNLEIEHIKSETCSSSSKEKNVKIFNRDFAKEILRNVNHINDDDLFNKYILRNQNPIEINKISSFIINENKIECEEVENNKQEFIFVLHLLFSNSDFNRLFKQKLSVVINIRKISDHSSIFETSEQYDFKLKHLFKFNFKSKLKNSIINYPKVNDARNLFIKNKDLDNKSNPEASSNENPSSYRSKINENKENLFILLQNSISLNMDFSNIMLKSNRAFNNINSKQVFEVINKIPFSYKENNSNAASELKNTFTFKDIYVYFNINNEDSRKVNERLVKNESIDNFISTEYVSNNSSEEFALKSKSINISDSIEFNIDEACFIINKYKLFYPIYHLIEKLEDISSIEYLVNLRLYEKIPTKNENKSKSIRHNNYKSRNSIALTFQNLQENFLATMQSSQASFNNQINTKNSEMRESSKRLSMKTSSNYYNPIHSNLANESEKNYFEIYKEISISLNIKHLNNKNKLFMIKIKEDFNWTTVGKSRIIEMFNAEELEKNLIIKLIPLQDGYIRLPELEFSDFQAELSDESEKDRKDSVNHMEFLELNKNTVYIEGNEKIVKINPVNQTSVKINVI